MKERHIIVAFADNKAIGYNGKLIYNISADMQHFKDLTVGNVVIMGRKTYESIGKPLSVRNNIVITSKPFESDAENLWCVDSLEAAYELAETIDGEKIFVIGGAQVYKDALQYTDILDITRIFDVPYHADTFFPEDLSDFISVKDSEIYHEANADTPPYRFSTWKRKTLLPYYKQEN